MTHKKSHRKFLAPALLALLCLINFATAPAAPVVDVSNLNHQSITATVTLGGAHPACAIATASCTSIDLVKAPK